GFFSVKNLFDEFNQSGCILRDWIRSDGAIAFGRIIRGLLLLWLLHCAEAAMHFLYRYFFFAGGSAPDIAEGINQRSNPVTIELVADRGDQGSASLYCALHKGIHVREPQLHGDCRTPQGLSAETAAFRPFLAHRDDRIPDHDLCVPDSPFILEAHNFLRAKGMLVELDCFSCIFEDQSWDCDSANRSNRVSRGGHGTAPFQIRFEFLNKIRARQIA